MYGSNKLFDQSEATDLSLKGFFPTIFPRLVTAHLLPNTVLGHRSPAALWAFGPFVDGGAGQALGITNC